MIQLVVFLGNYGKEYANTRHNVAWQFADSLPFSNSISWQNKFKGKYATINMMQFANWAFEYHLHSSKSETPVTLPANCSDKIFFLKPETYMNLSGESIIDIVNFYKLKPENILIIHDELELPIGTISLKYSGGLGGHNGLRSTKAVLNTADFWRLRLGISRPSNKDVAGYVLSDFSSDEKIILSQVFTPSAELLAKVILSQEPSKLLPEWNKKKALAD